MCPLIAMISLALHPASASRRHAALRSPCGLQRFGNPAASHHFRKLSLKCVAAVWLAGRGDEERQVFARRGVEHRAQFRMHRDRQRDAGLLLFQREHAVADVLAAHADDIAAPLRGVEQQRQRETRLGADG